MFECDTSKISGSNIHVEVSRGTDAWRGSAESLALPTSVVPEQWCGKPPVQRVCYPSPLKRMDLIQKRVEEAPNGVEDHKIWVAGAIRKLTKSFENLRTGLEACFPQQPDTVRSPDVAPPDKPPITLKKRKRTLTDITNTTATTTTTTIILDEKPNKTGTFMLFLIKWQGYNNSANSWVSYNQLATCLDAYNTYLLRKHASAASSKKWPHI